MDTLPTDWLSLLILTFVLGMKHGFDADHLATIDGLTRYNARRNPALARYCGTLFSLGHGGVVIVIALSVAALAAARPRNWRRSLMVWPPRPSAPREGAAASQRCGPVRRR